MTTIHNHLLPNSYWTVEDSNVLMKLKLKRENAIPVPSQIRQNLGPRLADAVFSNTETKTKELLGLGEELKGPGNELWSQPARQLMGEIILEPYPTRRHKQALTHQAILEYGEKCMQQWESSVAHSGTKALQDKLVEMESQMEEQFEIKLNQVRAKEREDFLVRLAMMEKRLTKKHQMEMEGLERRLTEEKEEQIKTVMENMRSSFQKETSALLEATNKLLTNRFNFKLNWIKSDLEEDYENKLRANLRTMESKIKQDIQKANDIDDSQENEIFEKVVCSACLTADFLLKQFHEKFDSLREVIKELTNCNSNLIEKIKFMEEKKDECNKEIKAWECVAEELTSQFQKFIEYQLKLPKGESTFLINWDKIVDKKKIIFEKLNKRQKQSLGKHETTDKIMIKRLKEVHEVSERKLSKEKNGSIDDICDDLDMLSIISSIIRRVIPSIPSCIGNAEDEIASIIRFIIKQAIPSTSSQLNEEKKSSTLISIKMSDIIPKAYCRTTQRTQREDCISSDEDKKIDDNKQIDEKLKNRLIETKLTQIDESLINSVPEITKVMEKYPNIMKFIIGP